MNTAPAFTGKLPAPFAAVVHFKASNLYQGKHKSYAFRSDDLSPEPTPAHLQYAYLENFILKDLRFQFEIASLFDNCGKLIIPPHMPQAKSKNLVWQANHHRFTIDNRQFLDLSWFDQWTFSAGYLQSLADSFAGPTPDITDVDHQYKQTFNL